MITLGGLGSGRKPKKRRKSLEELKVERAVESQFKAAEHKRRLEDIQKGEEARRAAHALHDLTIAKDKLP